MHLRVIALILLAASAAAAPARRRRARGLLDGASAGGGAVPPPPPPVDLCGMQFVPMQSVAEKVELTGAKELGSGAFGKVIAGKDSTGADVVVKEPTGGADVRPRLLANARVELLGGMMGCSTPKVAPCADGTPVMRYNGGASVGADVVGIFVEPMSGIGVEKFFELFDEQPSSAAQEPAERAARAWGAFAASVSPWLSVRVAAGGVEDRAAATAQRDLDAALAATQQTLLGLAHLWDRGVVHRDVKQENMMVNEGVFTLVDLGLACVYKSSWPAAALARLPAALRPYVNNAACLSANDDHPDSRVFSLACFTETSRRDFGGSPAYMSPAMLFAVHREAVAGQLPHAADPKQSAERRAWAPPEACVFNRRACRDSATQEDAAKGVDTFSVGVMLLEFLAGARILHMSVNEVPALGIMPEAVPGIDRSKVSHQGIMFGSIRIARYLALDDLGESRGAAPADATALRAAVRARARALLGVFLLPGHKARKNKRNVFARPPAEAAGIKVKLGSGAEGVLALQPNFLAGGLASAMADILAPGSHLAMQICPYAKQSDGRAKPQCQGLEAERDALRVAAAAAEPPAPGTDRLLDLLANLLSPSRAPGLLEEATTILELATSIDDIRAQLLRQWGLPGDELAAHIQAARACAASPASRAFTPAEASAHCRWAGLNPTRAMQKLAEHLRLAAKPGATIVAAAERASKSDHKPLLRFGWRSGTQVRHIVVAEANDRRLYLAYYDPAAALSRGFLPPKVADLELVRDGDGFGTAAQGGAKPQLRSQASLCSSFLRANSDNAFVKKRVRGGPLGAAAEAPLSRCNPPPPPP